MVFVLLADTMLIFNDNSAMVTTQSLLTLPQNIQTVKLMVEKNTRGTCQRKEKKKKKKKKKCRFGF